MTDHPLLIGGRDVVTESRLEVTNPFDGSLVGVTFQASAADLEQAVADIVAGAEEMRRLSTYERAGILEEIATRIHSQRDELSQLMALEASKPIRDARVEVDRAVLTMKTSAAEASRIYGETIPLDVIPTAVGRMGITRRFPIGPILAITPFNFPLNLVCHKLGPAIAAGNSILIKPAPKTPLTALALGRIALESGMPSRAIAVVLCGNDEAGKLVEDDRFKALSFTGSDVVGWRLRQLAGKKKVVLELGGNAGVIVDRSADVDRAAARIAAGGMGYAGQSCISVQRVYVHASNYDAFTSRLLQHVGELKLGDPINEETDVGPMIEAAAVKRTEEWVAEAIQAGGRVLTGGRARGPFFEPTVLADVPVSARISCEEAFAPVVLVSQFDHFAGAIAALNNSRFGLQTGIFTSDLPHVLEAFETLEVGGVIVNDVPTFRVDPMPYGGIKDSGMGREGIRYAIEELTELRLLVLGAGA